VSVWERRSRKTVNEPLVLGFFDASWPQPFENSQRMWSYDRTVEIDKPLVERGIPRRKKFGINTLGQRR